jgi:hypothetical protein
VARAPGRGTAGCRNPWRSGGSVALDRSSGLIYLLRTTCSYPAPHAQLRDLGLRLEIQSRSGQVLCLVRFLCALYRAPPLRFSDDLLRSKISPTFALASALRPTSDAKFPLSYPVAATAVSSIANPRRHPTVNHDPLRSLDVLSARGERAHPPSSGPAKLLEPPKLLSSSSVLVNRWLPAPISHQHRAHRLAWSPLLVPCSSFDDLLRPQLACSCSWGLISFVPFRLRR